MQQEKIENIKYILKSIVDLLYQENIEVAYKRLYIVLPYLEEVIIDIEDEMLQINLKESLFEALKAMEDEDNILLADILQYEVLERIEDYEAK